MKYEEAIQELESIVNRMESGEIDLDSMGKELKNAQKLIKLCRDKLTKANAEIESIMNEDE